jgi:NDP-sugar pyrophosphorylase family protein
MPEILDISRDLKKKVIVYPLHESWIDIGRPIDLEIANKNNSREA